MKKTPPYFKQESQTTCSLAVLRMVLTHFKKNISENRLREEVIKDYGNDFKNIWNPTLAKIAVQEGINTTMYALWPLFKKNMMKQAFKEFQIDPDHMNIQKYENPYDKDSIPEPLPLAYKEMFLAFQAGCKVVYGGITKHRVSTFLQKEYLIQTTIKLELMYPSKQKGYHALLLYGYEHDKIFYHDPYRGKSLQCSIDHLIHSATDVGAFMVYKK